MLLRYFLQKEEGMSLVEVVVGIAILSIALIPILNYFANSTKIVYQTRLRSQALNLAQEAMEGMKAVGYGQLDTEAIKYEGSIEEFTRDVIVSNYDTGIKKVAVIVSWDSQDVKLQTLIAKR